MGFSPKRQGNHAEALEKLSATLSTHSERFKRPELRFMYEDIQQRRAFLLVTLSRFKEAIALLTESLSFQLDDASRSDVLASLGFCQLELQRYELARDYFLHVLSLGPTDEWKGKIHFYLGIAYFHTDMLQAAQREFLLCEHFAAPIHNFSIVDTYRWLSVICRRLGQMSDAERYARMGKRN
jgi:tetratricopeptide (TPR) repeat protein